jgi:hypothetical protein
VDLGLEHESFGIDQQMALPAIDLLAAVVTAFLSAYPGGFDRLAIDYACTGLRISVQANSKAFPHSSVDTFPGTVTMRHFLK